MNAEEFTPSGRKSLSRGAKKVLDVLRAGGNVWRTHRRPWWVVTRDGGFWRARFATVDQLIAAGLVDWEEQGPDVSLVLKTTARRS